MALTQQKVVNLKMSVELDHFPANFFYRAIAIYLTKTQVVNRKLSCSVNVTFLKINQQGWNEQSEESFLNNLRASNSDSLEAEAENQLTTLGIEHIKRDLAELTSIDESEQGVFIAIQKMIPRDTKKFSAVPVVVIIDTTQCSASFHSLDDKTNLVPTVPYKFSFQANQLALKVPEEKSSHDSTNWVTFVLLKKIQKWMESCATDELQAFNGSHELIDSESYNETYAKLKEKYGQPLESNWSDYSTTDAKKFVYEDIAIASYLIVLWRQDRLECDELQSFVDLGCGNGLLVYILSKEGHRGYGIDLRRRRIWDQFTPETDLREMAIVPSNECLFPDVDWIIGNHSDELSPWIPVISARSSFKSKYFLIPCCPYAFSGQKFQRKGKKSQYLSFLDYLVTVSEACGFRDTKIDRLKIPSTKRICLVGSGRNIEPSQFQKQCADIQSFIDGSNSQGTDEKWSVNFKPRANVEAVRNCSRVDKSFTDMIVKRIFDCLLAMKETFCEQYPNWNCGGEMSMRDAVNLLSSEDLKLLKAECGGLQTMMKNKHHVFHVQGGNIKLRIPQKLDSMTLNEKTLSKIKTCPCYFFRHHKQSCPLEEADCSHRHE